MLSDTTRPPLRRPCCLPVGMPWCVKQWRMPGMWPLEHMTDTRSANLWMTWRLSYKVIKCLIFFMNDIIWFFVCFLSFGLILLSNRNLNYSRTHRGNTLIHFTDWTCFIKPFTDHVHLCQTTKFYSTINLCFVIVCGAGWNSLPEVGSHFWWCKVQCFWHLSLVNTEMSQAQRKN